MYTAGKNNTKSGNRFVCGEEFENLLFCIKTYLFLQLFKTPLANEIICTNEKDNQKYI